MSPRKIADTLRIFFFPEHVIYNIFLSKITIWIDFKLGKLRRS